MRDAGCEPCDGAATHVAEQAEPAAQIRHHVDPSPERVTCPICGTPNVDTRHIVTATCGIGPARLYDTTDAVHPNPMPAHWRSLADDLNHRAGPGPATHTPAEHRDRNRRRLARQLMTTPPSMWTSEMIEADRYISEMDHLDRQLRALTGVPRDELLRRPSYAEAFASRWERGMLAGGIAPGELRRFFPPASCWCHHDPADHSTTPGTGCTHRGCLCLDTPATAGPIPPGPATLPTPNIPTTPPTGVRAITAWWRRALRAMTDA